MCPNDTFSSVLVYFKNISGSNSPGVNFINNFLVVLEQFCHKNGILINKKWGLNNNLDILKAKICYEIDLWRDVTDKANFQFFNGQIAS